MSNINIIETVGQLEKVMNEDQHFKISFRDFINKYRLKEVKSKLDDTNYSHMSILGRY